jgi:peptidoglycan/LPS O-acetylase OafA/YrhL
LSFRFAKGGFVGVDVFFVISGYLITLHIDNEIQAGKFSFAKFYERRVRRIFPAMLVMLTVVTAFSYKLLFPGELADFAKTLIASILSFSNFYYAAHSSYFDLQQRPLLHTWSLAVEEQFYLLLPALLFFLRRYMPRATRASIALIAACSFCLSFYLLHAHPTSTFYLLHTRAWELLAGSLVALSSFEGPSTFPKREAINVLGLGLILAAVMFYGPKTPFPGLAAIPPCLGTVLLIFGGSGAGPKSAVERILSSRPFVGVGLISYSLYLWHFPLIILQPYCTGAFGTFASRLFPSLPASVNAHAEAKLMLFTLSLLAALLSWKFVEQPFRFGPHRPSRPGIFKLAAACSLLLLGVALVMDFSNGFPQRYSPLVLKVASYDSRSASGSGHPYTEANCYASETLNYDPEHCLHPDKPGTDWLLLGDSTANHLYPGLTANFPRANLSEAVASGCQPVLSHSRSESKWCVALMNFIYTAYLPHHRFAVVILAARWEDNDVSNISATIEYLKGLHQPVVLVGPIFRYDASLPRLLAQGIEHNHPELAASHRLKAYDQLDAKLDQLAHNEWNVPYLSYNRLLCNGDSCPLWAGPNVPLQRDDTHLTEDGARLVLSLAKSQNILPYVTKPLSKSDLDRDNQPRSPHHKI